MSMEEIQQQLKQLYDNQTTSCMPTGYEGWDQLTGGLVRGGLTLIGARPGMGRTSLALNIASRASRQREGSILIFSSDLGEQALCARLLQLDMGMHAGRLFDGSLSPEKAVEMCSRAFAERKGKIQTINSWFDTLDDIYECCLRTQDLQMVIVDKPECIRVPANWYSTVSLQNREPMDRVITSLRNLAHVCGVPVVCTACMHRSLESRKDKRPKLKDLEKINVPEGAVDQVVFLYRNCYYYFESDNTAECIIAKTPYGHTGTFSLQWHPETGELLEAEQN